MCIGCGRPMSAAAASTPLAVRPELPAHIPRSGHACPRCAGDLVTFRALHEAGGGTAPSLVTPPDRSAIAPVTPGGCAWAFAGAVVVATLAWYYGHALWAVLAFFVSLKLFGRAARMRARPHVEAAFREATERWERRHLCARCGAQVVRTENGALEIEDADAEIDALLRTGQKIQAIKIVRERTNLGLKEAKELVEAREKEL